MMTTRDIVIATVAAVLIHMALLFPFLAHAKNDEGAIAEGQEGLYVGVGIAGSYADIKEGKKSLKEEITEEVEAEVEENVDPELEPEPKSEPDPEPKPETKMESELKPEPKIEAKPKTKPVLKPKPKLKPKSKKAEATSKAGQASQKATGIGDHEDTGGNPSAKQTYLTVVKARIARFKKYPQSARRDGVAGTVTVRFVILRNGRVKQAELIKSSGDKRLDKEALSMLKRASPFPPLPSDVSGQKLDLTIPIEFSLKSIKNKFY